MQSTAGPIQVNYAPLILRLETEIGGMFVDAMDMLSAMMWRRTCKSNYYQVVASLRRSLIKLLRPFVPNPQVLLDLLTKHGALLGGELALSFLLRDPRYRPPYMDIYTSDFVFETLCDAIVDDPCTRSTIENHMYTNSSSIDALRRLVARTLTIRTTTGMTIYVHQSYTTSPAAPISRAPCTALSNYVNAYGFGCSHPRLTFARRGLLADLDLPHHPPILHGALDSLLRHQFSFAVSPAAWPEYRRSDTPVLTDDSDGENGAAAYIEALEPEDAREVTQDCWRSLYACPSQGRFFGDPGSFVDFFDPVAGDDDRCEENGIAPFGPMVVWRVVSSFDCDEGCDFDDILEEGATSIPVLIQRDPYGELLDVVSDRYMGDYGFVREDSE